MWYFYAPVCEMSDAERDRDKKKTYKNIKIELYLQYEVGGGKYDVIENFSKRNIDIH